jgi:DNA-directed RNA polymerase subunit RPC12/RpoP
MNKDVFDTPFEKRKAKGKTRFKTDWNRLAHNDRFQKTFGFKCAHCHAYVNSDDILSGVHNRNHCPYCLWSRHVDLYEAGDRLAACKAPMQPVGLSLKKTGKKYGQNNGELMVVHLCSDCGSVSANRIAADDDAEKLYTIYVQSVDTGILKKMTDDQIHCLDASQSNLVTCRLFGQETIPV